MSMLRTNPSGLLASQPMHPSYSTIGLVVSTIILAHSQHQHEPFIIEPMTVCTELENAVFLHFEAHFLFFLKINKIYVLICILEYIV